MKRTKITVDPTAFPQVLLPYFTGATVYDSSCSREARVRYLEKDGGYYLKSADRGALEQEAALTRFFHEKGLAAEVVAYVSDETHDYLLTTRVEGEDCTHAVYLSDPARLCDLLATRLRALHELSADGCPVPDRMEGYFRTAKEHYARGEYDLSYLPPRLTGLSADEAYRVLEEGSTALHSDTLLHGDYCLPNVMLDDWRFSGFVDVENGGVGDRHVDLFWGAWTLNFNLGTDKYRERFFDAYGRDRIDPDLIDLIGVAEVFG